MDIVEMETAHPKQFKDSPLGRIPTNWEVTSLGKSFDELYRYPTYYGIEYVESGIPEVRGELIKADGTIDENAENFRYISRETANRFQRVKLEQGDFVMTVRGTMGKIAMVPQRLCGAVITANLIRMKFTQSKVAPEWARHFLRSEFFQDALELATSATTIKTIQVPELCAIIFWRPPIKEQHHIAEILDTIDEAIQKTEALISKLKAMKQGLLHDLLTRGLDENGKLRDPITHPEQFKDSPFGLVPIDWDVVNLGELSTLVTSGSRGWASLYSDQGARFLRISNLTRGHVNLRLDDIQYVLPPPTASEGKRTRVDEGDLVISITADLGIIGVIPGGFGEAYVNQHIALVRLDRKSANPCWVANYLAFGASQKQFYILNDQGAKAGMNLPTVESLLVAVPEVQEQNQIAALIADYEARIRTEEQYRDKLKLQKKGLVHDLLTGKVRVKV